MNRTAPEAPVTTTVSGLSDRHLVQRLKELTAVEHQLEVVVIDHLRELDRRRLYLSWGFSSLFDYATHELGYSEAAAWRRIKAMRLCGEVEGARERMRDGSLTLNSAALLQNAFDRQERRRKQSGSGRGARAGDRSPAPSNGSAPGPDAQADARSAVASNGSAPGPGTPPRAPSAPAQAEEPSAAPVLDSSARQALVEEAAGKSTRQVKNLLAGVDPELAVPADRIRPLGAGQWELKAVIDDDCRLGLEQLKGLLSHVDPHMTLGQLVGRVVREAVERHDPARPPRGRRTGNRAASSGANETSAPKVSTGPNAVVAEPAQRKTVPAGVTASPAKPPGNEHRDAATAKAPRRSEPTFGAEGTGRAGLRNGAGAAGRHAGKGHDFASEGEGGHRARPRRGSEAARNGRPIRHFGAEGGMRPARPSRAVAAPGTRPYHPGRSQTAGLEARWGLLQLRGPVQRAPLRLPPSAPDRSRPSVRARRQRRARQPPSSVRRPSPPPPCGPGQWVTALRSAARADIRDRTAAPATAMR